MPIFSFSFIIFPIDKNLFIDISNHLFIGMVKSEIHIEEEKERGHSHMLVHTPDSHNDWGWAGLQPVAGNSIQEPSYVSHNLLSPTVCTCRKLDQELSQVSKLTHSDLDCTCL